MKKLYLLFWLLWMVHCLVFPQAVQLKQNPFTSDYSYHSFRHVELPSYANIVNTLIQDDQGMMWIGTKRGLFSYNGYNVNYHMCEGDLLESPIQAITQVSSRYLCIGRDGGLRWFDLEAEDYCELCPELPNMAIRSLEMFDGKLWIGTRDEGVFTLDLESKELLKIPHEGKEESLVFDLEIAGDKLFIGSYECLSYYDVRSKERHHISFGQDRRVTVSTLLYDERYDCIWIGTEGQLYRYNISEDKIHPIECLQGRSYKALALDTQGNLLLGTDNGLYIYNPARPDIPIQHVVHDSRNPHSLCNNVIWDIYCDKSQHVWLATDRGISFVQDTSPHKVILLPEIVHNGEGNLFGCLFIDSCGDYWMGGENGLIHISQDLSMQWYKQENSHYPLRHNRVRYIFEDSDKDIWIATDGSIARYDRRSRQFVYYDLEDETGTHDANWAYCIYEDYLKRFWIATYQGGLFVVNKSELLRHDNKKPFRCLNNHSSQSGELAQLGNIIYHLESDGQGKLYAVTQEGLAVIRITDCKVKIFPFYPYNIVFASDYLWYSEEGKLFCFNPQTEETYPIPLPDKKRQIHAFVHKGRQLWFSATDGIYTMNTQTFRPQQVLQTERNLQTGIFHPQDNSILWGGEDSFLSFSILPDKSVKNYPVYVTAVYSNKEQLTSLVGNSNKVPRYDNSMKLQGANDLQLDLSSFTYNDPNEEEFYYRINEEERWQSLGKGQNRLTFANLSGGTYKLQLCNGNPGENPQAVITYYTIQIPFPWYATPFAYCCYWVLLLIMIAMLIRRIQVYNKRKYEQKEREKSLELSNLKMDFFVNISHELKTPLSLIIAPLSRLMAETKNDVQRDSLAAIHQNALRLNTLIYKILDFKQIESEEENTLIRSHVDLCALIQNNIQTFSSVLKEKGIQLTFSSDIDYLWLNLDRLKIDSCIINILSNAIKYVPEKRGRIEVCLHQQENEAVITISDNGSGIDEQDLSLIFVRFFQGRNAIRQGSGIGLYLVKKFIGLHGGNVEIKNRQGTIVTLTIPIVGENKLNDMAEDDEKQQQLKVSGKKKLLVIDDNCEMVAFLTKTFSKEYICMEAYDGKEALSIMERELPDLIIVDEMMPVMNGLELSRILRRNQQTADIPIIMLTAKDDMQTELKSIKIGIDAFFSKPFDIKKLELRIAQLLYRRDSLEKAMRLETLVHPEFQVDENMRSQDELLLERIIKCVEENMEEESFNVSSLAEQVGIEPKRLYRKVKQFTGMPPVNYIRKLRMKKAAVLLAQQKFTVSEVMYLVGYSNASHFARCFTEEYGMPPKTFMKTNMPMA